MVFPYDDKYMIYDYELHRYMLTKEYVVEVLGIDIERRIASNKGVNGAAVINQFLRSVSMHVYNYVFKHNETRALTLIIAKCPSARNIIQDAMGEQAKYMLTVGDLSRSAEESKRRLGMDESTKSILDNREVKETGVVLTYIGAYSFAVPDYEQGGY